MGIINNISKNLGTYFGFAIASVSLIGIAYATCVAMAPGAWMYNREKARDEIRAEQIREQIDNTRQLKDLELKVQ